MKRPSASASSRGREAISAVPTAAAEDLIKEIICNQPLIPFHRDEIYSPQNPNRLRRILGLEEASAAHIRSIFSAAISAAKKACPGLRVETRTYSGEEITGFDLSMAPGAEWSDALRYAHGTQGEEALTRLSEPAAELLARIKAGEMADFTKELSVRHRLPFFGWSSRFPMLLQEILVKRGIEVRMEEQGKSYSQREHLLKFSITARHPPDVPPSTLNPVVPAEVFVTTAKRPFIRWFLQMLVDSPFTESEPRNLWHISTRKEFFRCFPALAKEGRVASDTITELLAVVRPLPWFKMGWDFSNHSMHWSVTIGPRTTWEETKSELRQELARPTSESQYGLTPAAACLYDWIRSLDEKSFEYGLTPIVEKAIKENRLLLDLPWSDENLLTFITLLCEEVTERTHINVRPMAWHDGRETVIRIRVRVLRQ